MAALFMIPVSQKKLQDIKSFLQEALTTVLSDRMDRLNRYRNIDQRVEGTRPARPGSVSNVITPVTQTRTRKVGDEIYEALFGAHPVAKLNPVTGVDVETGQDWRATAREATDWFDWAGRQKHELNAEETTRAAVADYTRYGLGFWKVVYFQEKTKGGVLNASGAWERDPEPRLVYAGPRWFYVSPRDVIWPEGYGGDVDTIPWIGQVIRRSKHEIMLLSSGKTPHYDPKEAREVVTNTPSNQLGDLGPTSGFEVAEHEAYQRQEIIELWFRYDVDDDGIAEELLCDYHPDTGRILRLVYNPYRFRPFFVARLAPRSGTSFDAYGIPELLESTQDQIDALHNLAITAGKVAARSVVLARSGSAIGTMLMDESIDIDPGFVGVTENPQMDLVAVPLGSPAPAMQALQLIQYLQQYAAELIGIGAAQTGDVSVARRAPAYGINQIMQSGASFTRAASRHFGEPFSRAVLMTFEIMRVHGVYERAYRVLGQDGLWVERLLQFPEPLYERWAVQVAISDPDSSPDAAVQRNMILAQFGMAWLEKLTQVVMGICDPTLPQSAKLGLASIAVLSEEWVRRVLENAKDMQDVSNLLPRLQELLPALMQQAQQEAVAYQQQQAEMEQMEVMAMGAEQAQKGLKSGQ